jgi:replication factor A1
MGRTDVRKTVAQIKGDDLGRSEKPDWITVMGTVWNIKTDTFCYPACTAVVNGTRCTKKVTNNVDGMWQCDSCEQSSQNCEYRYMLKCQILDHTGTITLATAFQEAGVEIIGLPAQDLFRIKHEEQDDVQFAEIIQRARYQQYLLKLKVQEETYIDEAHVKCNIVKAQKLDDTSKESRFLLGVIDSLLGEDGSGSTPAVNAAAAAAINTGFTSNNTYAMNMGGPNQFGQQASLSGGMPTTPSATRYAQPVHFARDSPGQATSYGPSAGGNASAGLCVKCSQPGHFARDCPAQPVVPQRQTYGNGAASGGYSRQPYGGSF